ncbi:unnamed protein product [Phaedon cochleariae]|uniref:Mitochondrial ribonuclease P catalytic subunit n=1 Tax=Phaedon cochleariae TaxID=80249 RepID=A0A9P0GUA9_PHACE|nr:unnamed protein product [Phaedon cochleariae]
MIRRNICRLLVSNIDTLYCKRHFTNREKLIHSLIENAVDRSKIINSRREWGNVRQTILNHEQNRKHYTMDNIDALILGFCTTRKEYELGFSYLQFLKDENIKPNLATIGKYFKLLYHCNEKYYFIEKKKNPEDEEYILKCYQDLRSDYPILDSLSLENTILGVSMTHEWKKCLDFMEEIKITTIPNNISYSAIISAAFLNNEEELGWQLLEEMFRNGRNPGSVIFLTYLSNIGKMKNTAYGAEKLERLFTFFHENDFKCDKEVADAISSLYKKLDNHSSFTQVSYKGVCNNCHLKLNNYEVGQEEFDDLKKKLFKNVIIGRDLFVKTNPAELRKFQNFINDMDCFDVVLDGLNIAYSAGTKHSPQVLSAMVAAVVSFFVNQKKKVLVLGRIHMNRWPKEHWGYVTNTCSVFLTQNISQDDPYLLYCALHSGKDTIIVTRDLMRGHKFLLKYPKDKILFNRWLSQRQFQLLRINEEGKPIFRIPPSFTSVSQKNDDIWHIPYENETQVDKNDFHKSWLCLKCR